MLECTNVRQQGLNQSCKETLFLRGEVDIPPEPCLLVFGGGIERTDHVSHRTEDSMDELPSGTSRKGGGTWKRRVDGWKSGAETRRGISGC